MYILFTNVYSAFVNSDAFVLKLQEKPILDKAIKTVAILESVWTVIQAIFLSMNIGLTTFSTAAALISKKFSFPNFGAAAASAKLRITNILNGMFVADAAVLASKGASYAINYALGLVNTLSNVKNRTLTMQLSMCDFINYTIIQNMNVINSIYKQVK